MTDIALEVFSVDYDLESRIQHCLVQLSRTFDGREAKEWALAAAVLIDKEALIGTRAAQGATPVDG